jgi:hypothetical protein
MSAVSARTEAAQSEFPQLAFLKVLAGVALHSAIRQLNPRFEKCMAGLRMVS